MVLNWLVVPLILAAAVLMIWWGRRVSRAASLASSVGAAGSAFISFQLRYQAFALLLALLVVGYTQLVPVKGDFMAVGDWSAPASDLALLAVNDGESWLGVGWTFLAIISVVTFLVIWLQIGRAQRMALSLIVRALPVAVVFSALNAFSEELIFRLALADALTPVVSATSVAVISGLLFGVPHWFGRPSGIIGVILAAFLGWFLMLSVIQTGGLGWAIVIHFVQDIVIMTFWYASTLQKTAAG
jgi:membrane protease YdiL (CAAX protease family)